MPRRKGTRQAGKRAKPGLKNVELGTSMSEEERQHKLEIYIADFKIEVEKRKDDMRREAKNVLGQIVNQYNVELLKLPKSTRDMKVAELFSLGGYPTKIVPQTSNITAAAVIPEIRKPLIAVENKTEVQTPAFSKEPPTATRVQRPRKAKATRAAAGIDSTLPNTRSRKQAPKSFITPAHHMNNFAFETPAVTPKFDPRLPLTGRIRDPKAGERIMSMMGSPLTNRNAEEANSAKVIIPSGNGQTLHICPDTAMSPNSIAGMGDVAKQQLLLLHQTLSSLVQNMEGK